MWLLVASAAIASTSWTLTRSKAFAWLRRLPIVGAPLRCTYCTSHWVAAVIVTSTFQWEGFGTWFVQVMAAVAIATVVTGVIAKAMLANLAYVATELGILDAEMED